MSDDEYEVPLRDQRYFGAGIKRKRINFVAASQDTVPSTSQKTSSAADKYLSIVLGTQQKDEPDNAMNPAVSTPIATFCEACQKDLPEDETTSQHEGSLVHQIALQHSHPPSAIDRTSKAYAVLRSQGWNPDSRRGLGADGAGILHPIKATENPAGSGLGATPEVVATKIKPVRLDAGQARALHAQSRKQIDKLRDEFYRSEAVDKLLQDD